MSGDFWLGLAVVPGFLVFAAVSVGIALGLLWLWSRLAPPHWAIRGPQHHARPAAEVFRWTEVAGGHAKSLRRLIRLGPFGLYVVRYAPGESKVREPERTP